MIKVTENLLKFTPNSILSKLEKTCSVQSSSKQCLNSPTFLAALKIWYHWKKTGEEDDRMQRIYSTHHTTRWKLGMLVVFLKSSTPGRICTQGLDAWAHHNTLASVCSLTEWEGYWLPQVDMKKLPLISQLLQSSE